MNISYGPNNEVYNYVPTKQRLGNKTLFSTSVQNGNTQVRYFSGTDAEIYFDELYIDEVVQIQYQIQQNTMPLFGYNSYTYDQVARGSRIINGSFTINFTQANYLYDVLKVLSEKAVSTDLKVNKDDDGILNDKEKNSSKSKLYINDDDNPMWNKSFEIILSYGDAKQNNAKNSTMLTLIGVVLTGCSQEFGINGDPIYETYSFIARDIASPIKTTTTTTQHVTQVEKKESITIENLTYNEYIDEKTDKIAGIINLSYNSSYPIEEVSMQLPNNLKVEGGMTKLIDSNIIDKNTITYRVSTEWREAIKIYCIDNMIKYSINTIDPINTLNTNSLVDKQNIPSSLKVNMIFTYRVNGSNKSKSMSGKLNLKNVYTDYKVKSK